MKAVRLKAYQQTASYRKPSSFVIRESYPLPPYSSVIGMIHTACGFDGYVPMQVSIAGTYFSSVSEAFTKYEFGGMKYEAGRHQLAVNDNDTLLGINRGLGHIQLLVDVQLLIYIIPTDETKIDEIKHGLLYPQTYLSLGRHEDLLRIDEVEEVELKEIEIEDNNLMLPYDMYAPVKSMADMDIPLNDVSRYNLGKVFDTNGTVRRWKERVDVYHLSKNNMLSQDDTILADTTFKKPMPVFPA